MKVKAAPGLRVPLFAQPRKYIDDSKFVEVKPLYYYRRLIAAGDLIEEAATPVATSTDPVQAELEAPVPAAPAAVVKPTRKGGK